MAMLAGLLGKFSPRGVILLSLQIVIGHNGAESETPCREEQFTEGVGWGRGNVWD